MEAVLAPDFSDGNPYQRELKSHLEARGVSVTLGTGDGFSLLGVLDVFPLVRAVRDGGSADVLHLHWFHPYVADDRRWASVLGGLQLVIELLVLRLLGVRVVWTVHNLLDHERRLPRWLEIAYRHAVFRLAHAVIVHCDRATEAVLRTYRLPAGAGRKVTTIPHGHYLDSYPNDVGRAAARDELGLGDGTVFLYFGRIRAYKNVPALVSAFGRLSDGNARLLVVGTPRTEAIAEAIAERGRSDDRVRTVFEFVPEDEVQRYLNAADVVVLPFENVLSSGSALLAMSFGRPVVAPSVGCVADLVPEELQYDPTDPDGLVDALERARTADLQSLGRRCRRRARRFDWESIARRTHEAYAQRDASRVNRRILISPGST